MKIRLSTGEVIELGADEVKKLIANGREFQILGPRRNMARLSPLRRKANE